MNILICHAMQDEARKLLLLRCMCVSQVVFAYMHDVLACSLLIDRNFGSTIGHYKIIAVHALQSE